MLIVKLVNEGLNTLSIKLHPVVVVVLQWGDEGRRIVDCKKRGHPFTEARSLGGKELEGTGESQATARLVLGGEKFLVERRPRK